IPLPYRLSELKIGSVYSISALEYSQQRQKLRYSVVVRGILRLLGESPNLGPLWAYFEHGSVHLPLVF
ncbi:MAG: hypothetical protein ACE5HR_04245, partial [bacterium]